MPAVSHRPIAFQEASVQIKIVPHWSPHASLSRKPVHASTRREVRVLGEVPGRDAEHQRELSGGEGGDPSRAPFRPTPLTLPVPSGGIARDKFILDGRIEHRAERDPDILQRAACEPLGVFRREKVLDVTPLQVAKGYVSKARINVTGEGTPGTQSPLRWCR